MSGSRRYDTPDTSRNNVLLALITLGEGAGTTIIIIVPCLPARDFSPSSRLAPSAEAREVSSSKPAVTAMAKAGLNIIDMLNKSRGDLAYTLVDVDKPINEGLLDKLKAIDGVLAVRTI